MAKGEIVLGCLAPHPPHVVYAENPEQNEAFAEGGWETLRWGYRRLARKLKSIDYDAMVIFTPHWQTYIGTHLLGVERFRSLSGDAPARRESAWGRADADRGGARDGGRRRSRGPGHRRRQSGGCAT